jgi:hypothetical protein
MRSTERRRATAEEREGACGGRRGRAGELLLLRSSPGLPAQADLLAEEIEWSQAFTGPVPGG